MKNKDSYYSLISQQEQAKNISENEQQTMLQYYHGNCYEI